MLHQCIYFYLFTIFLLAKNLIPARLCCRPNGKLLFTNNSARHKYKSACDYVDGNASRALSRIGLDWCGSVAWQPQPPTVLYPHTDSGSDLVSASKLKM